MREKTYRDIDVRLRKLGHEIRHGFAEVGERFGEVDQRFVGVDKKFEQANRRLEEVDKRFVGIDQRFERAEEQMVKLDAKIDDRVDELARMTAAGFAEADKNIRASEERIIRALNGTLGGMIGELDAKLSAYMSRAREDHELLEARVTVLAKQARKAFPQAPCSAPA